MKRVSIRVELRGSPDCLGRVSHDLIYTRLDGTPAQASFFADPTKTVARLRHNLAEQFWFDRYRRRVWREASELHRDAHVRAFILERLSEVAKARQDVAQRVADAFQAARRCTVRRSRP